MGADRDVLKPIAPMADEGGWQARYTRDVQPDGWQQPDFDDTAWREGTAAFGSPDLSFVRTRWSEEHSDLYVRRTIDVTAADLQEELVLIYSHDDVFELFINGTKVADTGETWREGIRLPLDGELKALLRPGKNVIAAHCHNTTGGAYTDFGLFSKVKTDDCGIRLAEQKSVDVLATSTYYTFVCGPVELDLVFTAPMLIDDYDLLSMPINYISYQVRSTDGRAHDAQLLLTASPLLAVNKAAQPTVTTQEEHRGVTYPRPAPSSSPSSPRPATASASTGATSTCPPSTARWPSPTTHSSARPSPRRADCPRASAAWWQGKPTRCPRWPIVTTSDG